MEETVYPFHRAWSLDYQVVLAIIDQHWEAFVEQVLDSVDLRFHKIGVHVVVHLIGIAIENHLRIETIDARTDAGISEVRLEQF